MTEFKQGDRVRIDIPDETDPDHRLHGEHGEVVGMIQDSAGQETGDRRDSRIYRVRLESDETVDVRWRDLRPPLERR
jgi:ribosomal protein L21E